MPSFFDQQSRGGWECKGLMFSQASRSCNPLLAAHPHCGPAALFLEVSVLRPEATHSAGPSLARSPGCHRGEVGRDASGKKSWYAMLGGYEAGCWLLPQAEGNATSRVRSLSLGGVGRGGKAGEISWGSQSLLSGWGLQVWGCHHYVIHFFLSGKGKGAVH